MSTIQHIGVMETDIELWARWRNAQAQIRSSHWRREKGKKSPTPVLLKSVVRQ
jgi:hypothetical protein